MFAFLVVLGFELKASHLLSRFSTTEFMPPAPVYHVLNIALFFFIFTFMTEFN
jgi:hypothetical protein